MPSPDSLSRFASEIARYTDIRARHLAFEAHKGVSPTKEEYDWVVKNSSLFQDIKKGRVPLVEDENKAGFESHTEAVRELLGGTESWKPFEPPSANDLGLDHLLDASEFERLSQLTPEEVTTELDKLSYVQEHFPAVQSESDTARGLIRSRPSWWKDVPSVDVDGKPIAVTNGLAYLRSIAQEQNALKNSTILLDTATKPAHTDGSQHYGIHRNPDGTLTGADGSLDPLLPLFQEVFGENANRFNHTFDELTTQLLPALKEKLQALFTSKGLPSIDFDVILAPFHTDQQFMVNDSPESSATNTWEWTNTPLIDQHGAVSGRRLLAGLSVLGGSGFVLEGHPSDRVGFRGARLAVVLKRH